MPCTGQRVASMKWRRLPVSRLCRALSLAAHQMLSKEAAKEAG